MPSCGRNTLRRKTSKRKSLRRRTMKRTSKCRTYKKSNRALSRKNRNMRSNKRTRKNRSRRRGGMEPGSHTPDRQVRTLMEENAEYLKGQYETIQPEAAALAEKERRKKQTLESLFLPNFLSVLKTEFDRYKAEFNTRTTSIFASPYLINYEGALKSAIMCKKIGHEYNMVASRNNEAIIDISGFTEGEVDAFIQTCRSKGLDTNSMVPAYEKHAEEFIVSNKKQYHIL